MEVTNNTETSFRDKWENNKDLAFNETLREGSEIQNWILNRNGWNDKNNLKQFLSGKRRILDAGCGNGRVTAFLRELSGGSTQVVGIDLVASLVAASNLKNYINVEVHQADLLKDNSKFGKFDFIYCQEVLHHTKNPEQAFRNLVLNNLNEGGVIAIYVYKKKAPLREFADDYIRERIINMPYDEAMKNCNQVTELARVLSNIKMKVKIPKVDLLEIEEGEYDIQRFVYHFFMKCFWSNELSFENNAAINYDWYHPQNCSRHTVDEIKRWFTSLNLKIIHEFSDFYGITMHGKKTK